MIIDQSTREAMESKKSACLLENEKMMKSAHHDILQRLPDTLKRLTLLNSEKGASIWLTTLPLQSCGYYLNKECFRDALCMRYGWRIPNMAAVCVCGSKNTMNHALICPRGGFVIKRHNEIRDLEAEMLDEVCTSVQKEPMLQPLTGEAVRGNQAEGARLDVSAVGFWRPSERMFADVRVFDPNCTTYKDTDPVKVYERHEREKKTEYLDRVINVERGSLTPLIFSTTGGWGKEASKFHKQLANLLAEKRNERYSSVMAFIRRRLRFSLLRTTLEALRGSRTLKRTFIHRAWKIIDIDFELIDNKDSDRLNF